MFIRYKGNIFNHDRITRVYVDKSFNLYFGNEHGARTYCVMLEIAGEPEFYHGEYYKNHIARAVTEERAGAEWEFICNRLVDRIYDALTKEENFDIGAWLNAMPELPGKSIGERYNEVHKNDNLT